MAPKSDTPRASIGGGIPSHEATVGAASIVRAVGSRRPPTPGPIAQSTVRISRSMLGNPWLPPGNFAVLIESPSELE